MGLKHISYKIAKCDICGAEKQFDLVYSIPQGWDIITDTYGYIKYECVCRECAQRVADYIKEYKAIHYKEGESDERLYSL